MEKEELYGEDRLAAETRIRNLLWTVSGDYDLSCELDIEMCIRDRYTLFGAIDIGSSEMELKIFELSRGKGMREIDCIRSRLELGKDTYATGKISTEKLEELCPVSYTHLPSVWIIWAFWGII